MMSRFQLRHRAQIAARADFSRFVHVACAPEDRVRQAAYRGPIAMMFYTTDGALHCSRVGVNRVLQTAVSR